MIMIVMNKQFKAVFSRRYTIKPLFTKKGIPLKMEVYCTNDTMKNVTEPPKKKQKTSASEEMAMKESVFPSNEVSYTVKTTEMPTPNVRNLKTAVNTTDSSNFFQLLEDHHLGRLIKKISGENLDCDYIQMMDRESADTLYKKCEKEIEYFTGDLAKVKVFGKVFDVPRKQVAYGDTGLTYTFSGTTIPALTWPPFLRDVRDHLKAVTGVYFSFVLVNRYADGDNYIGEHRDDEKDLNKQSPIASISLGQTRMFRFRHKDSRGGKNAKKKIDPVCVDLKHGTLLMMNYPTNKYWYHSLPKRQAVKLPRINLTFRDIKNKIKK